MDPQTIALTAEAVAIAGFVASILQERFFSSLNGNTARAATVLLSIVVGTVAVFRVGGISIGAHPGDTFAVALEILKVAGAVLVASQAAFRVFTKPLAA